VRIARDELRRIRELTRAERALHRELATLIAATRRSWSPSTAAGRCRRRR
jgi:hypothetical protein